VVNDVGHQASEPQEVSHDHHDQEQEMKPKSPTQLSLTSSERSYFEERLLLREFAHRINKEFASAIGMSFVECRVRDNRPGEANTRPRRGLKILEAPAKSLGGTIDQCCGPHGATAVLLFPAEFGSAERLA
jgi:hypothetical protein